MKYYMYIIAVLVCLPAVVADLNNGLVGYWSFDADNAIDVSGNGYNGQVQNNPTYTTTQCKIGGCYIIDQQPERINITNFINFEGSVTVAGWINLTVPDGAHKYYIYSQNTGANTVLSTAYAGEGALNTIRFYDGVAWRDTGANITTGKFIHLAYLFNSSDSMAHIYIDGVKVGAPVSYDGNITMESIYIGAWDSAGHVSQYNGTVDDFGIWNRTLTLEELQNLAAGIQPVFFPGTLVFRANDGTGGEQINTFNVTFNNGSFFSTSDGNITLANWTNGNYTATIRSNTYAANTTSFEHINSTTIVWSLYPDNEIYFTLRYEPDKSIINNVSYYVRNDDYSINTTTTNGTAFLSALNAGFYEVRYGVAGTQPDSYDARSYFFSVPLMGQTNTTLYLANASDTDAFIPTVLDENQNPIPGAYIEALRYYPNTNSYDGVEMSELDSQQGQGIMNLYFNTVPYKFRVYKNNEIMYEDANARYLVDQTLQFNININPSVLFEYSGCNKLQSNLTYLPATETFRWSYNDVNNAFDQYCLNVRYRRGLTDNLTTSCETSTSGIRLITIDAAQNGTFTATAIASGGGGSCVVDVVEYQNEPPGVAVLGLLGVFAGLIGIIVAFFLTLENPGIGILLGLAVLAAMSGAFLGFGIFSITAVTTLIIIGIILIYVTKV